MVTFLVNFLNFFLVVKNNIFFVKNVKFLAKKSNFLVKIGKWGFISGTSAKNETYIDAAFRNLCDQTSI